MPYLALRKTSIGAFPANDFSPNLENVRQDVLRKRLPAGQSSSIGADQPAPGLRGLGQLLPMRLELQHGHQL